VLHFQTNSDSMGSEIFRRSIAVQFIRLSMVSGLAITFPFAIGMNAQQPVGQSATQSAATSAAHPFSQTKSASPESALNAPTPSNTISGAGLVTFGPGDLIEVNVYNVPELTTKARVSNSGDVYLPLIDYVHIEGLTQEEAQGLIEKRLDEGGFVRNPHVTIFVDEAASQGVTVIGEVGRPGIYPDVMDHKLYEVLSEAGGFTQAASHKITIIRRNQPKTVHVDLPRNLGDDPGGNIEILPGDTITVPRAPVIYVVGDVGRPSGLLVDNGTITVLQALALAGGTNHTAKMSGARIIRKTPSGMTETRIQLKKMLEAKVPDLNLQPDDILFVPVSGLRIAASRTAEAALTMATAVSVYTVAP
jgi:polysaccharide biosynthesis/export protein